MGRGGVIGFAARFAVGFAARLVVGFAQSYFVALASGGGSFFGRFG